MECRPGCAACCIAPSISSPIPGMPEGKGAGIHCIQLDEQNLCRLFGTAQRPNVCVQFSASPEFCGHSSNAALQNLTQLEQLTR